MFIDSVETTEHVAKYREKDQIQSLNPISACLKKS